jgi:hypothetical protein
LIPDAVGYNPRRPPHGRFLQKAPYSPFQQITFFAQRRDYAIRFLLSDVAGNVDRSHVKLQEPPATAGLFRVTPPLCIHSGGDRHLASVFSVQNLGRINQLQTTCSFILFP